MALDRSVEELRAIGGLPRPEEAEHIWEALWYEETHHSTAIEGNTLVLKEVKALLDEGRAVGDRELREYLEVQAYAEAARWVYGHAVEPERWGGALVSVTEIREMHRLAVEPVWRHFAPSDSVPGEGPGSFRRHDVNPFPSGMTPPPWPDVPARLHDWVESASHSGLGDRHYAEHAADMHAELERIHPFIDGNGRTGRLVLNLMLVRAGYAPAVVLKRDRQKYLRGLARADAGDPGPLGELIARAAKTTIDRFLLPELAGPSRMIPIAALADTDLSQVALRRAAERGRLRAQRRTAQWYSTKRWVDEYKASRHRRS